MDLSAKEIQEPSEEWMWGHVETSFYMSNEEDPLAVMWRGLDLSFRQPLGPIRYEPVGDEPL